MGFTITDHYILVCLTFGVFVSLASSFPYTTSFATPQFYQHPQNTNFENPKIFSDLDAPQIFPTTESPLANPQKTQEYRDFLKELYRFDKEKDPQTFQTQPRQQPIQYVQTQQQEPQNPQYQFPYNANPYLQGDSLISSNTNPSHSHHINKRAIIFRPLFVYRQQTVKRQKLEQERKREQQASAEQYQASQSEPRPSYNQYPNQYYPNQYPSHGR